MTCLCQLLEGNIDAGRRVKERSSHGQSQVLENNFFFWWKVRTRLLHQYQSTCISVVLCKDSIALGESLMLNIGCSSFEAFPSVGTYTKQESISARLPIFSKPL